MAFSILLGGSAADTLILPPIAEALIYAVEWLVSFAILGASVLAIGLPCGSRVRERSRTAAGVAAISGVSVAEGLSTCVF